MLSPSLPLLPCHFFWYSSTLVINYIVLPVCRINGISRQIVDQARSELFILVKYTAWANRLMEASRYGLYQITGTTQYSNLVFLLNVFVLSLASSLSVILADGVVAVVLAALFVLFLPPPLIEVVVVWVLWVTLRATESSNNKNVFKYRFSSNKCSHRVVAAPQIIGSRSTPLSIVPAKTVEEAMDMDTPRKHYLCNEHRSSYNAMCSALYSLLAQALMTFHTTTIISPEMLWITPRHLKAKLYTIANTSLRCWVKALGCTMVAER